ncbi:MAG TPA: hypothetical protein VFN74_01335 [Chloroflexota bacterium]|nr:hypothetical protein [Chloroflexota bacterium]
MTMTELTFTAGERATLDLRDSAGEVTIKDWDGATIKVEAAATPFVLREQDTFRLRLPDGGVVSLPIGLPVEALTPAAVRLRVTRAGGETEVWPVSATAGDAPRDFSELGEAVADIGKRIARDVAKGLRGSGAEVSDDLARKIEEAAERFAKNAERHASRVAEHAERHAERAARHAERVAQRATRHAERGVRRGRWWFNEHSDEWSGGTAAPRSRATEEERLAIMQMLRDGKITAEQASTLLDALGG